MLQQLVFDLWGVRLEPNEHRSLVCATEAEMVERFDSNQLVHVLSEKGLPIVGGDDDGAVC